VKVTNLSLSELSRQEKTELRIVIVLVNLQTNIKTAEKKGKGDVTSSEERTKSDEFEYFSPRRTNEDASRKLAANPACFKG
jgi:hypothetical protein